MINKKKMIDKSFIDGSMGPEYFDSGAGMGRVKLKGVVGSINYT